MKSRTRCSKIRKEEIREKEKINIKNYCLYVTNTLGRDIRRISGPTDSINSNEYRFCMRVGHDSTMSDYHFWLQTNKGAWCEKNGTYKVIKDPFYVHPSTANWDKPLGILDNGEIVWSENYYDSDTIYFAASLS